MYTLFVVLNIHMRYCGIIPIRGGQCSWIVQILQIRLNVISWVTGSVAIQSKIIHYIVKHFW